MPRYPPTSEGVARALLRGALRVRPKENVLVESWPHTLEYAAACVVEARRVGARPLLVVEDEGAFWESLSTAPSVAHVGRTGTHEWALLERSQCYVTFPGPADRPRLHRLPPEDRAALDDPMAEWFRRARRHGIRGVRSMLGYASDPLAELYGVDPQDWLGSLVRATVNTDLPTLTRTAARAARTLSRGRLLHITASNGTDISMRLQGRVPFVDDGVIGADDRRAGRPMTTSPPGLVLAPVDETSAEGIVVANRPSFLRTGRVSDGQWEFHRGRLVRYAFGEGGAGWEGRYQKAGRGRDILGLFSLGLNPEIRPGTPQVEDQEAGAVSLALGGNAPYGGANRTPYLSWLVVGEAMVAVDGRPFSDRGQIL